MVIRPDACTSRKVSSLGLRNITYNVENGEYKEDRCMITKRGWLTVIIDEPLQMEKSYRINELGDLQLYSPRGMDGMGQSSGGMHRVLHE